MCVLCGHSVPLYASLRQFVPPSTQPKVGLDVNLMLGHAYRAKIFTWIQAVASLCLVDDQLQIHIALIINHSRENYK